MNIKRNTNEVTNHEQKWNKMGRSIEGTGILVHTILPLPVTFIHHSLLFLPQLPIRFYVCFFLAFCCTCAFSVWHSIYFLHLINSLSLFFSPSHSFPLYYSHPLYTALIYLFFSLTIPFLSPSISPHSSPLVGFRSLFLLLHHLFDLADSPIRRFLVKMALKSQWRWITMILATALHTCNLQLDLIPG